MPTSTDLIELVADACGLAPASVGTVYRQLREAELVGSGGRGRNAMLLDLFDATKLAVATLASGEARDAATALSAVYALRAAAPLQSPTERERLGRQPHRLSNGFFGRLCLHRRPRPATFASAIDQVMTTAARRSLTPMPQEDEFLDAARPTGTREASKPFLRCEIRSQLISARFRVATASLTFGIEGLYRASTSFRAPAGRFSFEDGGATITETRSVGLSVFEQIAGAFEIPE